MYYFEKGTNENKVFEAHNSGLQFCSDWRPIQTDAHYK